MAASAKHRISCLLCISPYLTAISICAIGRSWYAELIGPRPNEPKASNRVGSIGCGSRAGQIPSPFLQEPKPQSQTLRAYAAKLGLYFGTMADSMPGNGGETPWVQKIAGSEFNLLEPGNQLKWWMTGPSEGTFDFGLGDALDYAVGHDMKGRNQ